MIYIVTIHHDTDKFIDLQEKYYKRYTTEEYKIYAGLSNANNEKYYNDKTNGKYKDFHFVDLNEVHNQHWYRMNYLVQEIIKNESNFAEDDLLIFTDGDAFPVYEWEPTIRQQLEEPTVEVVAIQRSENPEPALNDQFKPYPHPCFFATKMNFWTKNRLTWSLHPPQIETAGPILKLWLAKHGFTYKPLLRSNIYNIHPLYFGIYGDIIYHHGAGNREVYDSIDIWPRVGLNPGVDLDLRYPNILRVNKKLSNLIFEEIIEDDNFINVYLMGRP
tara:strand:+ start:3300 stop:4121 length:822 start_codon:yes stop_codon:yes gene_type:complete